MNLSQLEQYTKSLDLLLLTVEQIKKDFNLFGLEVSFSGNQETAYEELTAQIKPYIESLLTNQYQRLLSLLYRIDLPEKTVAKIILNPGDDMSLDLTDLILKRELQKVVIREHYKQQQNENFTNKLED